VTARPDLAKFSHLVETFEAKLPIYKEYILIPFLSNLQYVKKHFEKSSIKKIRRPQFLVTLDYLGRSRLMTFLVTLVREVNCMPKKLASAVPLFKAAEAAASAGQRNSCRSCRPCSLYFPFFLPEKKAVACAPKISDFLAQSFQTCKSGLS
jgi:hypothetical protein